MRLALLLLIATGVGLEAQVSGRVVNALTGEGVGKALVTLDGNEGKRSARTTKDGSFVFPEVAEGEYSLESAKRNYFAIGAAKKVRVIEGQKMEALELKLEPAGVVRGRLLDEDGEPIEGGYVAALRRTYHRGVYGLKQESFALTNELGEFRLAGLRRGKYLLRAAVRGNIPGQQAEAYEENRQEFAPLTTYFPGVAEVESAQLLAVQPGQEYSGMEFRLLRGRVFRVAGRVQLGEDNPQVQITLEPIARMPDSQGDHRGVSIQSGSDSFEIRGVSPGRYMLTASTNMAPPRVGKMLVTVTDKDVTELEVAPAGKTELRGTVKIMGDETLPPDGFSKLIVQIATKLSPYSTTSTSMNLTKEGSFHFKEVPGGLKTFRLQHGIPGTFIQSFRLNGVEMEQLDFEGGGEIDLVLSKRTGKITGSVDEPREAKILLEAVNAKRISTAEWKNQIAVADAGGNFTFAEVAPGEYRVYAFAGSGQEINEDPEFLRHFSGNAVVVRIGEGEAKSIPLRRIAAAAVEEAMKQ
ncbi:MAG: carboxypeptidase regulatory-like domain-containing protein [Bryobacter sp.]|nr:carboxypeptidase regulatory-like domain-containing protein [Bryobacter sp.]